RRGSSSGDAHWQALMMKLSGGARQPAGRNPVSDVPYTLEDQGCIDAAKGEIVGHDVFRINFAKVTPDVVERRTALVNFGEVDIRREAAFPHHLDCQPCFDGTAGAERMAEIAFQRMDRRIHAENVGRRPGFSYV